MPYSLSTIYSLPRRLFFEDAGVNDTNAAKARVVGKAVLTGVSVGIFFSSSLPTTVLVAEVALAAFAAHIALTYLASTWSGKKLDEGNSSWFAKNRAVAEVSGPLRHVFPWFFGFNMVVGALISNAMKRSGKTGVYQPALRLLVRSFHENYAQFFKVVLRINFIAPLIEEIIFRGFVEEKIRDIQVIVFKGNADTLRCKLFRVALQASLFAACHFSSSLGLANIGLFAGTFIFGLYAGGVGKEKDHTLWQGVIFHAIVDISVCTRVLLFGV